MESLWAATRRNEYANNSKNIVQDTFFPRLRRVESSRAIKFMPLESPEIRSPSASHNTEFKVIRWKQLRGKICKPRKGHVYLSLLRNQP